MLARWKGFENLSNKTLLNKVGVSMENKGFNFIATLEAVNIFIGGGYIEGLLMDRWWWDDDCWVFFEFCLIIYLQYIDNYNLYLYQ